MALRQCIVLLVLGSFSFQISAAYSKILSVSATGVQLDVSEHQTMISVAPDLKTSKGESAAASSERTTVQASSHENPSKQVITEHDQIHDTTPEHMLWDMALLYQTYAGSADKQKIVASRKGTMMSQADFAHFLTEAVVEARPTGSRKALSGIYEVVLRGFAGKHYPNQKKMNFDEFVGMIMSCQKLKSKDLKAESGEALKVLKNQFPDLQTVTPVLKELHRTYGYFFLGAAEAFVTKEGFEIVMNKARPGVEQDVLNKTFAELAGKAKDRFDFVQFVIAVHGRPSSQ